MSPLLDASQSNLGDLLESEIILDQHLLGQMVLISCREYAKKWDGLVFQGYDNASVWETCPWTSEQRHDELGRRPRARRAFLR